ncbi:MAG TPA: hypothetical protein DEO56_02735 [Nitrosomonas nitrosa]|nr:hypothetical protein [Nitrosomonas nitrosa]
MKSICITGAVQSNLQTVADILQRAGMKQPEPAKRDSNSVDIEFWHEQVMTLAAENASAVQPISNPGRLWEQLASDIFVANIKSKVWGWSNTQSTWLLDYWLDFETHLNFILVCISPQQMLANAIASESNSLSVDSMMNDWQTYHQELLRFHHRNPQRSLLVDLNECIHYPGDLIKRCIEQWKLPLVTPSETSCYEIAHDSVAFFLAQQLCQDHLQVASLQHELAATVTRLNEGRQISSLMALTPSQIIDGYRALRDRSTELQQMQAANEALAALTACLDDTIAEHAQQQKDMKVRLKESAQQNELLQLQLHKAKEEFKSTFLKYESQQVQIDTLTQANATLTEEKLVLAAQRDTLEQEITVLTQARNEQGQLAAERQAKIDALTHERDSHASHATERQAQIDTLTQANATLTEEKLALAAQRDALQQEVETLHQTLHEQTGILAECRAQIEQLNKTQAENSELLLLELHHAHLESEHYFQQYQDTLTLLQTAEGRWQRLLQRNPAYLDYETIEILSASDDKEIGSLVAWRLTNFSAVDRHFPSLEFKTLLERGVAGFIFPRLEGDNAPLVRWPALANEQNELLLMPTATTTTLQQRAEILLDLATSDWSLLQALTTLLIETLASSTILEEQTDLQPEAFRAGLEKLSQILQKFPPTLRYDHVQLKREQVKPDYEHLWLHFDNLSFDGKHWPEFEFRLACANVQPDRFGFHPKLEFPEEGGKAPFEAWFVESSDDFGAKLELRFAQPDAMDMNIWRRLTKHDRTFLAALIKRLPAILGTLQGLDVQLKRPWADWSKTAREIQRITVLRTAGSPAPASAPIQPAVPAEISASPSNEPKQHLEPLPTIKIAEKPLSQKPVTKTRAAKPVIASEIRKVQK